MSLAFTAKCYYVRKRKRLTKDEGGDYSRNAEECFLHENMRFGFEESDEENNDMNPDWEDAFEKSGLGDKLREMNELQLEGADVYMSTFAALKNYPFFREVHNWFYPFSKQQSNVLKAMKQAGNQGGSLLDLILQSGFFSNSDKYSLFSRSINCHSHNRI